MELVFSKEDSFSTKYIRHQTIYERFSWSKLRNDYVKMFELTMKSKSSETTNLKLFRAN